MAREDKNNNRITDKAAQLLAELIFSQLIQKDKVIKGELKNEKIIQDK